MWAEARCTHDRLDVTDARPEGSVDAEFSYTDQRGDDRRARVKLFLPAEAEDRVVPLLYQAGYESADRAAEMTARGWALATPVTPDPAESWPGDNPMVRGPNLDVRFLHILRTLPFVDDARVAITGGSAGGWMTLMLAAETFPLGAAVPEVPIVDWPHVAAYWLSPREQAVPVLDMIQFLAEQPTQQLGTDFDGAVWRAHDPVSYVHQVTCPILTWFSTGDVSLPMAAVDTLLARLPAHETQIITVPPPGDAQRIRFPDVPPAVTLNAPVSDARWTVVIIDEGDAEPDCSHTKYSWRFEYGHFLDRVDGHIAPAQVTQAKLERLIDRVIGIDIDEHPHLDDPQAEKMDVARGIQTFLAQGEAHRARFDEVYASIDPSRQVL